MEQKPIKKTTIRHPDKRPDGNYSGGFMGPDKKLLKDINKAASKDQQSARTDPKLNPAGKARMKSDADSRVSLGGWGTDRITDVKTTYRPDAGHLARQRGSTARKKAGFPIEKPKFR